MKCIDCGIKISLQAKRCYNCYQTWLHNRQKGSNHPNYKNGNSLKRINCTQCGKEIAWKRENHADPRCVNCKAPSSYETRVKQSLVRGGNGVIPKKRAPSTYLKNKYKDYGGKFTEELKKKIRQRDNNTCQTCFKSGCKLYVHHIDYDKLNCNEDNLITLCNSCHAKTNFNREKWQKNLIIWNRKK